MKPFDLEAALRGEKVVTRDGRKVIEIHCFNAKKVACVVVSIEEDGDEYVHVVYTNVDGFFYTDHDPHDDDLFMSPTKKKGWIILSNPIDETRCEPEVFNSKETALREAVGNYQQVIEIEWEE